MFHLNTTVGLQMYGYSAISFYFATQTKPKDKPRIPLAPIEAVFPTFSGGNKSG